MNDVGTIMRKEWADTLRNKLILYVIIFVPLVMTAIPIILLFVTGSAPVNLGDLEEMRGMLNNPLFAGMDPREAIQSVLASNMLVLFLIMPLMVPVTIASYSIVGEKITRSLEPLLATPITTSRLLIGKSLAAALPGVLMTWLCYAVFLIVARFLAVSDRVFSVFIAPMWLIVMLILVPLLTILAVSVGVIISSRVNDPRAAEQLGALVILPFMILFIGAFTGIILLNATTFVITSLIVAVIDLGLVIVGTRLFQRETILTRWK